MVAMSPRDAGPVRASSGPKRATSTSVCSASGRKSSRRESDRLGERSDLTHQRDEVIRRDDGGRVIDRALVVAQRDDASAPVTAPRRARGHRRPRSTWRRCSRSASLPGRQRHQGVQRADPSDGARGRRGCASPRRARRRGRRAAAIDAATDGDRVVRHAEDDQLGVSRSTTRRRGARRRRRGRRARRRVAKDEPARPAPTMVIFITAPVRSSPSRVPFGLNATTRVYRVA